MSEEEKEVIEQEFEIALDNIVSKIKGETATAIVHSEQSMILLFKKLMYKIEKQQKELGKEKEKNKELEMQLLEKDLHIDGLKEDRRIAAEEIQEEYYISKDKIREKMQQDIYTNEHTILGGRRHGKTLEYGIRLGRIQMCEELLEERK